MTAAVLQVNVPQSTMVLSERAALTSELLSSRGLKPGAVVDGVVRTLKDFGAFVALRSADGHMHGAEVRLSCSVHVCMGLRELPYWRVVLCVTP